MADNIDPYSKFIIAVIDLPFEKQKSFLYNFATLFLLYDQRPTSFGTTDNHVLDHEKYPQWFKAIMFLFC